MDYVKGLASWLSPTVVVSEDVGTSQITGFPHLRHRCMKLQLADLASRGDLLFSRALVLFEGETEEQALPVYAESYWGATAHEKGFSFVGCGGANYFPFVWLAQNFGMRWYILCDGEEKTITRVSGQLKRIGLDSVDKLDNISIIDGKAGYEAHLVASGYMDAIETAFEESLGKDALDKYIADLNGKPGAKVDGKENDAIFSFSVKRRYARRSKSSKSNAPLPVRLHRRGAGPQRSPIRRCQSTLRFRF